MPPNELQLFVNYLDRVLKKWYLRSVFAGMVGVSTISYTIGMKMKAWQDWRTNVEARVLILESNQHLSLNKK